MKRQSQHSLEYIEVPILAAADPTASPVQMAFPLRGASPGTFLTGSWRPGGAQPGGAYVSRCLIGPGGGEVTLTPEKYDVYVKITDAPEAPVLYGGVVEIF